MSCQWLLCPSVFLTIIESSSWPVSFFLHFKFTSLCLSLYLFIYPSIYPSISLHSLSLSLSLPRFPCYWSILILLKPILHDSWCHTSRPITTKPKIIYTKYYIINELGKLMHRKFVNKLIIIICNVNMFIYIYILKTFFFVWK